MSEFADTLWDSDFLDHGDRRRNFRRLLGSCKDIAAACSLDPRNLEHLWATLQTIEISGEASERLPHSELTVGDALSLLKRGIVHLATPEVSETGDSINGTIELVEELCDSFERVSFVTTNYDVHIEIALRSHGLRIKPPQSILLSSSNDPSARLCDSGSGRIVDVVKLHGSVNWRFVGNNVEVLDRFCRRQSYNAKFYRFELADDLTSLAQWSAQGDAAIVPPALIKASPQTVFLDQWKTAAALMSECDGIIFLGFSFPESDQWLRSFVQANLARNTNLRRIEFVDPSKQVCDRVSATVFSSQNLNRRLRTECKRWEDWFLNGRRPLKL